MRKTCFLTAAGLLAALTVLPAQAQWYGDDGRYDDRYGYDGYGHDGYGYNNGTFRCESRDRRTTRCPTRGYRVQLIRQFSDMACVRGRTWGQDGYGVWVTNGCRGLFAFDNRGHSGWNNNGWNNNGWNNSGHYGSDFVRCESRDNRSRTCAMSVGRNNGIRLVRQLSDTPCIEGRNWGVSRNGVWVSGGCRAEFVVSRGRGRERPPGDLGNVRPPGDLGNGYPPGGRVYRQGNDDGPPPGVLRDGEGANGQGARSRGPRLVDVPRGDQTPPPGVITDPVGGGMTSDPPGVIRGAPRPRPAPISVAQSNDRPPGRPTSSEPAPGVFRTLPAEQAPAPRQAPLPRGGQEERARETP
jgi:hypothetical protein